MKVLVIDNNDSFVYNLIHLLRQNSDCSFEVNNVNGIDFDRIANFTHILISPGPGVPSELPNLNKLIELTYRTHSILGICLGLQAIGSFFGFRLTQLMHPNHGIASTLRIEDNHNPLFKNIAQNSRIGLYHSWVLEPATDCMFDICAYNEQNFIMAIKHRQLPIFGLQFHPESIITQQGQMMIDNWLNYNSFT